MGRSSLATGPIGTAAASSVAASTAFAPASVIPAATAAARSAPLLARLGLVHRQRTSLIIRSIEGVDCRLSFGVVAHLDKSEAAGPAGVSIGNYLGAGH